MTYEINGTRNGELYTLTENLTIDPDNKVTYNNLNINDIKKQAQGTDFDTITVYVWKEK